jgi:hypothetical protein
VNGVQIGKRTALVMADRVFNTGGWLGNAADVFSVQRKYK